MLAKRLSEGRRAIFSNHSLFKIPSFSSRTVLMLNFNYQNNNINIYDHTRETKNTSANYCTSYKTFGIVQGVTVESKSPIIRDEISEIEKNQILRLWESARSKASSCLPKGSSKMAKELDKYIHQYISHNVRKEQAPSDSPNFTLLNSLTKLNQFVQAEDPKALGIYMELITISCLFGYLPLALHLTNAIHKDFKLTLDYSTYKTIVKCFIDNGKFDECFNFIVELEEKNGVKPNYQLYLPLYLKMKEILTKNEDKPEHQAVPSSILNQMIPRLSKTPDLVQEIVSRDIYSAGLLGGRSKDVENIVLAPPLTGYEDYPTLETADYSEENHIGEECGDESCGHDHGDERYYWKPHAFRSEWEHLH
ncbi:hypothetical protein C9374_008149 [Naegleria lovaniensis]|uniref:Pentatricopeptide repeat-containing protein n=1 Tax=Naegleria lovaniensis TaxID=51637 RepID=A0AA88GK04_NAELO|nr:uncharacterized protein C9374_008149 [Naegleria lovaniensis]KAG2378510.1 hypothetical protein C9374_008149 [Naegleria lovaniensis]